MPDHAALYTAGEPPAAALLRSFADIKEVRVAQEGSHPPTQYRFRVNEVQVTVNVMPVDQVPDHLDGFCGYVYRLHRTQPSPLTDSLIARIRTVKTVLGCVIEPGWDDEGIVTGVLLTLNELQDGLLFVHDSIIGPDGTPLVGPLAEPPN
jgi:hypothetical protein